MSRVVRHGAAAVLARTALLVLAALVGLICLPAQAKAVSATSANAPASAEAAVPANAPALAVASALAEVPGSAEALSTEGPAGGVVEAIEDEPRDACPKKSAPSVPAEQATPRLDVPPPAVLSPVLTPTLPAYAAEPPRSGRAWRGPPPPSLSLLSVLRI